MAVHAMPSSLRAYAMFGAIASGGMATVYLGRVQGPAGFARRVAIKRLHPHLARDPELAAAFVQEAHLAARVAHANVAAMLDIVANGDEVLLVMEYVHGESLAKLVASCRTREVLAPVPVVLTVVADMLHGLQAVHEAKDEDGLPMRLIHRDVSPQNVIVGADGVSRLVDFGIARAATQASMTAEGTLRGKLPYVAPERLMHRAVDRRVDVYAAGVTLWEGLTGKRLFRADDEAGLFQQILSKVCEPPSASNPDVEPALDEIVMRAIARDPDKRFATAEEMAAAIEALERAAPASAVARWVGLTAKSALDERAARLADMEREAKTGTSPAIPEVRTSFASVVFHDPPDVMLPPDSHPKRLKLWIGLGALVASLGALVVVLLVLLFTRSPTANPPVSAGSVRARPEAIDADRKLGSDSDPIAQTPFTAAATPLTVASAPKLPPATTATQVPRARPNPSLQWCKVFDAEKRVFVLKPMQVARCP